MLAHRSGMRSLQSASMPIAQACGLRPNLRCPAGRAPGQARLAAGRHAWAGMVLEVVWEHTAVGSAYFGGWARPSAATPSSGMACSHIGGPLVTPPGGWPWSLT